MQLPPADLPGFIDNCHSVRGQLSRGQESRERLRGQLVFLQVEYLLTLRCNDDNRPARREDSLFHFLQCEALSRSSTSAKQSDEITTAENLAYGDALLLRQRRR